MYLLNGILSSTQKKYAKEWKKVSRKEIHAKPQGR